MKSCRSVGKNLSAYQDNELGLAEMSAIEAHLFTCEGCRKKHEALLHTYRALRSLSEIEPTPGLSRRILDKATPRPQPFWVRALGDAFRWLPAPAALITLAAAGLLVGTMLGNFLIERQFRTSWTYSELHSEQPLTLASVHAFDATPPGSFAAGYLKLADHNQEKSN